MHQVCSLPLQLLAGAAGALFGLNYSSVSAAQFDFNQSILVLVYVVPRRPGQYLGFHHRSSGALCSARSPYGSLLTCVCWCMPSMLILVMLATNNPQMRGLVGKIIPQTKGGGCGWLRNLKKGNDGAGAQPFYHPREGTISPHSRVQPSGHRFRRPGRRWTTST